MYKLEAVDTVIFREANSFDAGVHFHSSSKFPPYPATYAGVFKEGTSLKDRDIKIGFNGVMLDDEYALSLIHISEPTRRDGASRMPSSA